MASFIASQFKSAIAHTPVESWWGGGHTPETLPTNKGWRCRFMGNGGFTGGGRGLWLMGQRNVAGCASIQWYPSMPEEFPALDVALYDLDAAASIERHKCLSGQSRLACALQLTFRTSRDRYTPPLQLAPAEV